MKRIVHEYLQDMLDSFDAVYEQGEKMTFDELNHLENAIINDVRLSNYEANSLEDVSIALKRLIIGE